MDKAIIQTGDKVVVRDSYSTQQIKRIPSGSFVWNGKAMDNPDGKLFVIEQTEHILCHTDD